MSGQIPDEIRPEFELTVEENLNPNGVIAPNDTAPKPSRTSTAPQNSSAPTPRPTTPAVIQSPTEQPIPVAAPSNSLTDPLVDSNTPDVPPLIPPIFGARATEKSPDPKTVNTDLASRPIEGEIFGPENSAQPAITDQRSTSVDRRQARAGRNPGFSITPNDPANGPRALPPGEALTPPPTIPNRQIPIRQNMEQSGAPRSVSGVTTIPSPTTGNETAAIRVDIQGRGTFYLTESGEIINNEGRIVQGIIPPDIEQSILTNPMTSSVYQAFKNALRTAR